MPTFGLTRNSLTPSSVYESLLNFARKRTPIGRSTIFTNPRPPAIVNPFQRSFVPVQRSAGVITERTRNVYTEPIRVVPPRQAPDPNISTDLRPPNVPSAPPQDCLNIPINPNDPDLGTIRVPLDDLPPCEGHGRYNSETNACESSSNMDDGFGFNYWSILRRQIITSRGNTDALITRDPSQFTQIVYRFENGASLNLTEEALALCSDRDCTGTGLGPSATIIGGPPTLEERDEWDGYEDFLNGRKLDSSDLTCVARGGIANWPVGSRVRCECGGYALGGFALIRFATPVNGVTEHDIPVVLLDYSNACCLTDKCPPINDPECSPGCNEDDRVPGQCPPNYDPGAPGRFDLR